MAEKKIWLVGLHMVTQDTMILFGGQAISDNNLKYTHLLKYKINTNKLVVLDQ